MLSRVNTRHTLLEAPFSLPPRRTCNPCRILHSEHILQETVFSQAFSMIQHDITLTGITQAIHGPFALNFFSPAYITGPLEDLSLLYPTFSRQKTTMYLYLTPFSVDIGHFTLVWHNIPRFLLLFAVGYPPLRLQQTSFLAQAVYGVLLYRQFMVVKEIELAKRVQQGMGQK